eukprot:SAG11_NODE_1199_length_5539_cov_3.617647_1_plen_740_part_00
MPHLLLLLAQWAALAVAAPFSASAVSLQPAGGWHEDAGTKVRQGGGHYPVVEDWHYPVEESSEFAQVHSLRATSVGSGSDATVTLVLGGNTSVGSVGQLVLGWRVRCILNASVSARATAILEKDFARWGLFAFVSVDGTRFLRKGVGALQSIRRPRYQLEASDPLYFNKSATQPDDFIKQQLLASSPDSEPTFAAAASLLPPPRDYMMLGTVDSHTKFSMSNDGRIKCANFSIFTATEHGNETAGSEPGRLLFDPRDHLSWWPATNHSDCKTALLGRFSRAASVGVWDQGARRGFTLSAVPSSSRGLRATPSYDQAELMVRLEEVIADQDGSVDATVSAPQYFAVGSGPFFSCKGCYEKDLDPSVLHKGGCNSTASELCQCQLATPGSTTRPIAAADFYVELAAHTHMWENFHAPSKGAMQLQLNYNGTEGQRLVDQSRAAITAVMSNWIGMLPVYGTGSNYWKPGDRGSLPFTSLALNQALLLWGHPREAAQRVSWYFSHYVRNASGFTPLEIRSIAQNARVKGEPGSLDLKLWRYTSEQPHEDHVFFTDSYSDYGRMIDLWCETARAMEAHDTGRWARANWGAVESMTGYLFALHDNATEHEIPAPATGLIFGPPEHDTCRYPGYWFAIQSWSWRGWVSLARFLNDTNSHVKATASFSALLASHTDRLKRDLDRATAASLIRRSSKPYFLPPFPSTNFTPFPSFGVQTPKTGPRPSDYGGGSACEYAVLSSCCCAWN